MQNSNTGMLATSVPVGGGSQPAEMMVLEDPHHRAESGGQRKDIEHKRFQRQHHAAGEQEQQHEGDHARSGPAPTAAAM